MSVDMVQKLKKNEAYNVVQELLSLNGTDIETVSNFQVIHVVKDFLPSSLQTTEISFV